MGGDRVTELRVQGLRVLADVSLPLHGLTVLIGDNGAGKSSLLEALELLHKAARPGSFVSDQLGAFHGGLDSLLRAGAQDLSLGVKIEGGGPSMDYRLSLAREGSNTVVAREQLDVFVDLAAPEPLHAILRDRSSCRVFDTRQKALQPVNLPPTNLALTAVVFEPLAQPAISRTVDALARAAVHPPFDVRTSWVAAERHEQTPLRAAAPLNRVEGLARLGDNLVPCLLKLKAEQPRAAWERTLERVRAGLGTDVTDLPILTADRGKVEFGVSFRGVPSPILGSALSEGQLAYLAFVVLAEPGGGQSVLAFDEPESHLHPELLVRVVWLLEELARDCPVIVATHSDRLLDAVAEPGSTVVLCDLDEQHGARLRRPDRAMLAQWLERYRGLGAIRAEGYEPHVFGAPLAGTK